MPHAIFPLSNDEFWKAKLERSVERDWKLVTNCIRVSGRLSREIKQRKHNLAVIITEKTESLEKRASGSDLALSATG